MLTSRQIDRIAKKVAVEHLDGEVRRIFSEPYVNFEGEDAIRVTIVIKEGAVDRVSGRAIGETLTGINQSLRKAGDDRFAYVSYATEDELAEVDGT